MTIDIRVPEAGESITQVELAKWLVEDGDYVEKDQEIAEIDSDKATLTINADEAGKIKISVEEGSTVEPGKVIGQIDTKAEKPGDDPGKPKTQKDAPKSEEPEKEAKTPDKAKKPGQDKEPPPKEKKETATEKEFTFSPSAKRTMDEMNLSVPESFGHPDNKRITKKDLLMAIAATAKGDGPKQPSDRPGEAYKGSWGGNREEERQKMSTLRKKIAERLVAVKNQTAMLTTFNEVDMSAILSLRKRYQKDFQEKYGIKLGFMSFFAKAVAEAIPFFPQVNGYLEDNHIVIPSYADIGIAVSTPKGLMVPVVRNAEGLSIPELEKNINELAEKARENKISIEELSGGTISITNGGVFGSLLSTPIINPPQSAILGMHKIEERPVAINGQVEIRPMMYLALSYDHRVVDGKESVGFLVKVKEFIENPASMLFQGKDPMEKILGL